MFVIPDWSEQNFQAARAYLEDTKDRLNIVCSHSTDRSIKKRARNAFYVLQAAIFVIEREPDPKDKSLTEALIGVLNDGLKEFGLVVIPEKEYAELVENK